MGRKNTPGGNRGQWNKTHAGDVRRQVVSSNPSRKESLS